MNVWKEKEKDKEFVTNAQPNLNGDVNSLSQPQTGVQRFTHRLIRTDTFNLLSFYRGSIRIYQRTCDGKPTDETPSRCTSRISLDAGLGVEDSDGLYRSCVPSSSEEESLEGKSEDDVSENGT